MSRDKRERKREREIAKLVEACRKNPDLLAGLLPVTQPSAPAPVAASAPGDVTVRVGQQWVLMLGAPLVRKLRERAVPLLTAFLMGFGANHVYLGRVSAAEREPQPAASAQQEPETRLPRGDTATPDDPVARADSGMSEELLIRLEQRLCFGRRCVGE